MARRPALLAVTVTLAVAASLFISVPAGSRVSQTARGPATIPRMSFGVFDGSIDEITRLEANVTRVSMAWGNHEPRPGRYNWGGLDRLVLPASQAGLPLVMMIHANSAWGSECGSAAKFSAPKEEHLWRFREFVRRLVERYDGDGIDDVPGLGVPIRYWQVENQWSTAAFYRGSDNCMRRAPDRGEGFAANTANGAGRPGSEDGASPLLAAAEYVREYTAVYEAAKAADPGSLVGPGNIPTLAMQAALFCSGRLGPSLPQNFLDRSGTVLARREWTRSEVCDVAGPNTRGIKTWVRYWNVVLESVMPRLAGRVDFLDLALYGPYEVVPLYNEWALERMGAWGFTAAPVLVSWEAAGPDRRQTEPGADPPREVALDLPKRLALAFATGSRSVTWFHNHYNPAASPGLRYTSLRDASGRQTPAYDAHRLFVEQVSGAETAILEELGDGRVEGYAVHFDFADGRRVTLAWADRGLEVVLPVEASAVHGVVAAPGGASLGWRAPEPRPPGGTPEGVILQAPDGRLRLILSEVPVYVIS